MKKYCFYALALAVIAFVAPRAFAKGSLVVNKHNPDHYGWAVNFHSQEEADRDALSHCTGHCEVVYRFEHTCAAFASETRDDGATGWAHEESEEGAKRLAVAECQRYARHCEVRVWGCDK